MAQRSGETGTVFQLRQSGLWVLEPADEGHLYLCLGNRAGWFVVCPLEEI